MREVGFLDVIEDFDRIECAADRKRKFMVVRFHQHAWHEAATDRRNGRSQILLGVNDDQSGENDALHVLGDDGTELQSCRSTMVFEEVPP